MLLCCRRLPPAASQTPVNHRRFISYVRFLKQRGSNGFKTLATSNFRVPCCEGTFNTVPNWDIIGVCLLNLHLCAPRHPTPPAPQPIPPPPPLALSSHSAANPLLVSSPPAARLRRRGEEILCPQTKTHHIH